GRPSGDDSQRAPREPMQRPQQAPQQQPAPQPAQDYDSFDDDIPF
ncbi:single-stranded DNA-binding protein, partial [Pseudomonas aeruginosa]